MTPGNTRLGIATRAALLAALLLVVAACSTAASPTAVPSVGPPSLPSPTGTPGAASPSAPASPVVGSIAPILPIVPPHVATGIRGTVQAGPTCPVEQPGTSACAPRPVGGAVIVVLDASGAIVMRITSDRDGTFSVGLRAGTYTLEPQPQKGLLGTARNQTVTVPDTGYAQVTLEYDTGIR